MAEAGSTTSGSRVAGPRCIALVGPYLSGKTTLLESLLFVTGRIARKGGVGQKNSVGDASPEARAHAMSVERNVATTEYLGDSYTFVDCPGSIEFFQEGLDVLPAVDAAIVVCEPDAAKAAVLRPYLKPLEDAGIPHLLFVNKIETAEAQGHVRQFQQALQAASDWPLVLRQIPIRQGQAVTGYYDLALQRSYVYHDLAPSEVVDRPKDLSDRGAEARFQMLERLADYDDRLMEELLSDETPPREEVLHDLAREAAEGLIVPVLLGSAERDHGIRRLLKALRHEAPPVAQAAARLGVAAGAEPLALAVKSLHSGHGGKLSIARILRGALRDGDTVYGATGSGRIGGMFRLCGAEAQKVAEAGAGEVVGLGRLDEIATGDLVSTAKGGAAALPDVEAMPPVYALSITVRDRKDEVKVTAAIAKLCEEDRSLVFDHSADTREMLLRGQGEVHLRVALERLKSRYGMELDVGRPKVAYRETIRKGATHHYRHKRQSGGHGQFGDVVLEVAPQPRGAGFTFTDGITGGVIPRQYIPGVEAGVRDALEQGPLGFPVIDVAVAVVDGSYHTVDSSDMAFRIAARQGMGEVLPQCAPVLLEPILHVEIAVPSAATARVNGIVSGRRGRILGFDARPGWSGWDVVAAEIPEAEMADLIVELRSASQGTGSFTSRFDHLAELSGKLADQVVATTRAA
jgi:elongation factor G